MEAVVAFLLTVVYTSEIDDFRTLRIAKSMSDKDRPKHVGRVYFSGSNSPWLLGAGIAAKLLYAQK